MKRSDTYRRLLREQLAWIAERGGDLAGYLCFYQMRDFDNVKAIYEADTNELNRIKAKCKELGVSA